MVRIDGAPFETALLPGLKKVPHSEAQTFIALACPAIKVVGMPNVDVTTHAIDVQLYLGYALMAQVVGSGHNGKQGYRPASSEWRSKKLQRAT